MPAPPSITFSVAAKIAANTELLALLDAATTAAKAVVRDASDTLLVSFTLGDPAGTVNMTTGQLSLDVPSDTVTPAAAGTAAYVQITDGNGVVHCAMPAIAGSAPVSGFAVLTTLAIQPSVQVRLLSITFG